MNVSPSDTDVGSYARRLLRDAACGAVANHSLLETFKAAAVPSPRETQCFEMAGSASITIEAG